MWDPTWKLKHKGLGAWLKQHSAYLANSKPWVQTLVLWMHKVYALYKPYFLLKRLHYFLFQSVNAVGLPFPLGKISEFGNNVFLCIAWIILPIFSLEFCIRICDIGQWLYVVILWNLISGL
jgi:hypothetical protein